MTTVPAPAPFAADEHVYRDESELLEDYFTRGWTDGLPVVAPTPERVTDFLAAAGLAGSEVLGSVPTRQVTVTAEAAAINAVMAGCRPEYFPVVAAALRAHLTPLGNSHSTTGSMMGPAHAVIVNGPIRDEIGIAYGPASLGPGYRANATIGRAFRLVIRNVCHGVPSELDRATFSTPARYSFCFGENEADAMPWRPLHVQRGHSPDVSTATVVSVIRIAPLGSDGQTPEEILDDLGDELRHTGTRTDRDGMLGDQAAIVLVVGREHMRHFHAASWSKEAMQEYLLQRLLRPATSARDLPIAYSRPEQLVFVAAGGVGMAETYALMPHHSAPITEVIS